jgi:hypothetical protein
MMLRSKTHTHTSKKISSKHALHLPRSETVFGNEANYVAISLERLCKKEIINFEDQTT